MWKCVSVPTINVFHLYKERPNTGKKSSQWSISENKPTQRRHVGDKATLKSFTDALDEQVAQSKDTKIILKKW